MSTFYNHLFYMKPVEVEPRSTPVPRQPHVPWRSRDRDPWDDLSGNGRVLIERDRPPNIPGPKRAAAYGLAVIVLWRIKPDENTYTIIRIRRGLAQRFCQFNSAFSEVDFAAGRTVVLSETDLMWLKLIAEDPDL